MSDYFKLLKASALMRERARAVADECGVSDVSDSPWFDATDFYGGGGGAPDPVHAHVASWSPEVALAVADLLEEAGLDWPNNQAAVAVARAYVGESET